MTLRTPLCDLLGIDVPVMLAGMGPVVAGEDLGGVAGVELAAAVSNAGGLGVIGAAALGPDEIERAVAAIRELTDRPFGVDILLPSGPSGSGGSPPPAATGPTPDAGYTGTGDDPRDLLPAEQRAAVDAIRERLGLPEVRAQRTRASLPSWAPADQVAVIAGTGVPVLAVGLGSPAPYVGQVHAYGGHVVGLVGTPSAARKVADAGADVVVAQGYDAGGHTGQIGTMALLPQVIDAIAPVPVVAAGGIADGRGLAAALAMGCIGAWVGTAFIATPEAHLDGYRKQRILDARAEDTRVTRLYSGKTMRNIRNDAIDAWEASGTRALGFGAQSLLIADLMAAAWAAERPDLQMNAAGQASGLLHELRPAADVLAGMVQDAEAILRALSRLVVDPLPAS